MISFQIVVHPVLICCDLEFHIAGYAWVLDCHGARLVGDDVAVFIPDNMHELVDTKLAAICRETAGVELYFEGM